MWKNVETPHKLRCSDLRDDAAHRLRFRREAGVR
jgi:hypothetical protein